MKSAIDRIFCLVVIALILSATSACGKGQTPLGGDAERMSVPADSMRSAVLRKAVIANGFVKSADLAIPAVPARARVGKLIFSSNLMSLNGAISCRDCHLDEFGSADGLPNAIGVGANGKGKERLDSGGQIVPRNVLPLWGRGGIGFDTFFWDGKVASVDGKIVSQFGDKAPSDDPLVVAVHLPSVELREMVNDTEDVRRSLVSENVSSATNVEKRLARRFASDALIGPALSEAYAKPQSALTFAEVGDALANFIREKFRIRKTKLERFVFEGQSLNEDEVAGGILFYGRGKCVSCHGGPYFSDLRFHAVAFPQVGFGKNGFGIDEGRYNVTFDPADRFLFRTPPLYNVSKTAPYSHSGSTASLEDAIVAHFDPLRLINPRSMTAMARSDLYARLGPASREILPANLTDEEVTKLVKFLRLLDFRTDE